MSYWLFQLSENNFDSLGLIRCLTHLQIAVDNKKIWLKTPKTAAIPDVSFLKLPLDKIFLLDEKDNLFLGNATTPTEKLPSLNWHPIASFVAVNAPVSCLPGKNTEKINIRLKESSHDKPGIAILTNLYSWKVYGEKAAEARLKSLRFAVAENESVLIIGEPLPTVPGQEYWSHGNLLIPSGFDFELPVIANLIRQKLASHDGDTIMFDSTGNWDRIPESLFVPATRSSIRLTQVKGNA